MTSLDRAALTTNLFAVLSIASLFPLSEMGSDAAGWMAFLALMLTITGLVLSSIAIARKDRQSQPAALPVPQSETAALADELDPHAVLDLDARLDALERAQHDAVDAARWRALVESGQVTAPASDVPTSAASGAGPAVRNGQ